MNGKNDVLQLTPEFAAPLLEFNIYALCNRTIKPILV